MTNLKPHLNVFFNAATGKKKIGEIGWNGKRIVVHCEGEGYQNRIQNMWNTFLKYNPKELKGSDPEKALEYLWKHLNNASYYTFGKPEEKKDESKVVSGHKSEDR